jgi:hypothetical protein
MADLLAKAEQEDQFRFLCKRDVLNSKARESTSYTLWPDQDLARTAKSLLPSTAPACDIVVLHPSAEGGMPHTRGTSLICLPAHYLTSNLASLLHHEVLHLRQKLQPAQWRARLQKEGWEVASASDVPQEWLRRCRLNPDTLSCRFVAWKGAYIPLPLYVREDRPQLRDVEVRWWDRVEQRLLSKPPASFTQIYGTVSKSAMEHPFELWAYQEEENRTYYR